ncbi:MAG: redoxin domain-containing protein, partial [Bacteroidales bacterium]|nr:redoxin domain-containing protein [Bacteroidales bacterium]
MQLRRSIAISIVVTLFSILPMGAQQIYSSVRSYLDGIVTLPIDSIIHKCDLLIAEGENAENQSKIAGLIFDYFTSSPIMGADGVAVHIADNYFLNKKLSWPNASSYPALFTFAEFNRESLIGNRAPSLDIEDIDGNSLSIPKGEKGLSLLYFFDDHCASCAKETPAIASFLQHYDGAQPLTLYAVYTQSDKESWKKYADLHFNSITNPQVRVYNLWDPEATSSFHMKYGVLSTPRLFLVDQENRIVGRMLDSKAIVTMIENDNNYFESLNTL